LKKYFQILALPETASHDEIKKKYRKLAMRLHPDRNPSPKAKEDFLQITEAYEILTGKKTVPKTSRSASKSSEKSTEVRVKEAKQRIFEQQEKERLENERYFQQLFRGRKWKVLKFSAVLGVVLTALIICDYFLPSHLQSTKITHYTTTIDNGGQMVARNLILTATNEEYFLAEMDKMLIIEYPAIFVEKTWIFHNPIKVLSDQKTQLKSYPIIFSFYSVHWIVVLFFLLPVLIVFYKRRTVWYTLGYQIALYFSTSLMVIYLILEDRWAHLITLGFI
jgi:hypothetical protein